MNKQFEFNWNAFQTDAVKSRSDLCASKRFSDVTLVTDDQTQFEAHRIILAGASTVFDQLLSVSTEKSSLIFLNGVKSNALMKILEYIYLGNVSVEKDRVREFLGVARDLQISSIDGIVDHQQVMDQDKEAPIQRLDFLKAETLAESKLQESFDIINHSGLDFLQESQAKPKRIKPIEEQMNKKVEMINNCVNTTEKNITDSENKKVKMITDSVNKSDNNITGDPLPSLEEDTNDDSAETEEPEILPIDGPDNVANDTSIDEIFAKTAKKKRSKKSSDKSSRNGKRSCDEPAECEVCAKKFTTLRSMQRHHKIVHELVRIDCPHCDKSCPGRDALRIHIIGVHEKRRVFCDKCDASFPYGSAKYHDHMKNDHPLPSCDFHNLTFQTIEEFDLHIQDEHINKNWN